MQPTSDLPAWRTPLGHCVLCQRQVMASEKLYQLLTFWGQIRICVTCAEENRDAHEVTQDAWVHQSSDAAALAAMKRAPKGARRAKRH